MRRNIQLAAVATTVALLASGCGANPVSDSGQPAPESSTVTPESTTTLPMPTWQQQPLGDGPSDGRPIIVEAQDNIAMITVREDGITAWISTGGDGFREVETGSFIGRSMYLSDAAWGDHGIVAVGTNYEDLLPLVWRSTDGRIWSVVQSPSGLDVRADLNSVTATADGFVAGGSLRLLDKNGYDRSEPAIWTTSNGDSWNLVELAPGTEGHVAGITTVGDQIIAVGRVTSGMTIWQSDDQGATWSLNGANGLDLTSRRTPSDITAAGETVVIVGGGEGEDAYGTLSIATSLDGGQTWSPVELSTEIAEAIDTWGSVRATANGFWLVTRRQFDAWRDPDRCYVDLDACFWYDQGLVLFSEDGLNWAEIDLGPMAGTERFIVADVISTETGRTVLVATGESLDVWTWPSDTVPPIIEDRVALPSPDSALVAWGDGLEIGVSYRYPLYVHCGMNHLGRFNTSYWYLDGNFVAQSSFDDWPMAQQTIFGMVTLTEAGYIEYSIPSGEVIGVYLPSDEEPPGCI